MWSLKHKKPTAVSPPPPEKGDVPPGPSNGNGMRRVRNVSWRTMDISPEVFIQIRDNALIERNGAVTELEEGRKQDETMAEVLRIADYHFIVGFRAPKNSPLPDPQRPEGQMRQFGFLPLGIATDRELKAEALYVLIQDRERPVPVPPYLRHDIWSRLVSILGQHLHNDLHIVLLGTGGRVVERAIDFFFYQGSIGTGTTPGNVVAEPIPTDPQQNDPEQIKQARTWLRQAINSGASDMHLEPGDGGGRFRMRVDGELVAGEERIPPGDLVQVITWIKAQARMDISERRRPLDGGVRLAHIEDGKRRLIDVRVSTIPTIHGQKMVMRLLDPEALRERVAKGLQGTVWHPLLLKRLKGALSARDGIVLVTGPTGSGKTTTLNASLFYLLRKHADKRNMVTIEDPVEYNVPGVNQIQVNEQAGITFARALRHILRQDPDIVLVGEIRDAETASVAIQAALTGHLILATLHTNDAIGAVERLQDLGVSPFLIASTVRLFQAQRLVRTLCPTCGQWNPLTGEELERKVAASRLASYRDRLLSPEVQIFEPTGCGHCNYTGFLGRTAVMEMAVSTPALVAGIEQRQSIYELTSIARESGYMSIVENGIELVVSGQTSLAEIEAISLNARLDEEELLIPT